MGGQAKAAENKKDPSVDFRTQQMFQMADIDGHIGFIKRLMERYDFPEDQKRRLLEEIERMQERQNKQSLNMAVVGEFSSGKSSFINALLQEKLLETDAVQGTTVDAVLIYYSLEKIFCTYGKGGRGRKTQRAESSETLAKLLKLYTSDEQKEENARYLEVGYPSDFLRQGICIIDTPGTNSLEQWHEENTKKAIREQADACIILTSAEKPFPESFCRFLEENLQDILQTCIFVVTKMDLIPPKQQKRQMDYIRKILEEKLSVHSPLLLPYSALPVLNGTGMDYIEINRETEEKILKFLQEQRIRIQLQSCISLAENAMEYLKKSIEQISVQHEAWRAYLNRNATADLNSFILKNKAKLYRMYQEETNGKAVEFAEKLNGWIGGRKGSVYEEFQKPATESDICSFLKTKLNPLLEEKKNEILRCAGIGREGAYQFLDEIRAIGEKCSALFEENFRKEYRQLETLAHNPLQEADSSICPDESLMRNVQADMAIRRKTETNEKQENRSFLGYTGAGAAAGAAIGSVVPIIGTTMGAVIGGFAGLMQFGRKSDDVSRGAAFRSRISPDVTAVVEQYFRSLEDSIMQSFYRGTVNIWMQIENRMEQYRLQYTGTVEEMRERDRQAQEEAAFEIREIQKDINLIQQKTEQIQLARVKFRQM